jgi:hypothetical protein
MLWWQKFVNAQRLVLVDRTFSDRSNIIVIVFCCSYRKFVLLVLQALVYSTTYDAIIMRYLGSFKFFVELQFFVFLFFLTQPNTQFDLRLVGTSTHRKRMEAVDTTGSTDHDAIVT